MRTLTTETNFQELFNLDPQITICAPGRVNLMGDHTDYNRGYVLPTVIPQETYVQLTLTQSQRVRVFSAQMSSAITEYIIGKEHPVGHWIDYVQGLTKVLAQEGLPIQGFDLKVYSEVPVGSGLSSSAALEIAVLRALREILNLPLKDVELARIGQRAENEFVGAPVGIMDQMACLLAQKDEALFLNTADLSYHSVLLPRDLEVVVICSGIMHNHAQGEYRTRRLQCEEAARRLSVNHLSELSVDDITRIEQLEEPYNRRARHVVTENQRVKDTVEAFRRQDRARLRELFYASHQSLKEDYAVSIPEIDFLIEQSKNDAMIVGARITGGGFGGCIVMLADKNRGQAAAEHMIEAYRNKFKKDARLLVP